MGTYRNKYEVGAAVRIVERSQLERFQKIWRFHNPLKPDQLTSTGRTTRVANVGFFHGGDPIYGLEEIPGTWHESCLSPVA